MDDTKRVNIISVTLLLYVAIVTFASTLLKDIDTYFASWLTAFYCIDVFLLVLYFIFVQYGFFSPDSKLYKSNERLFKIGDYCLLPNLFIINFVFAYFVLSACVPSVREIWLLKLYGSLIGANFYFGLFFVSVPISSLLVYVLQRLLRSMFNFISFHF